MKLEVYSSPENCPACRRMENIYMALAEEYDTIFIDPTTDDGAETAYRNDVASMPTLVVFKDGVQVERFSGIVREKEIKERLEEIRKGDR